MRVKIHIELITDWDESATTEACEFARPMTGFGAETLGLSLEDGKVLLQTVQQHVVAAQAERAPKPVTTRDRPEIGWGQVDGKARPQHASSTAVRRDEIPGPA